MKKGYALKKTKQKKIYKNQDDQTLFSKVDVQTLEMLVPLKKPQVGQMKQCHTQMQLIKKKE